MSASVASAPAFMAPPLPTLVSSDTTRAPACRATWAVRSVDPSSTTITSEMLGASRTARTTLATVLSSLYAGMTAATFNERPPSLHVWSDLLLQIADGFIKRQDPCLVLHPRFHFDLPFAERPGADHHPEGKTDEVSIVKLDSRALVSVVK